MTSIRSRLIVALTLGVSLIWLVGLAWSTLTVRHEIEEMFDDTLREAARRLLFFVELDAVAPKRETEVPENFAGTADSPDDDYRDELISYVVKDRDGRLLMLSEGSAEENFPTDPLPGFSRDSSYRFYGEVTEDTQMTIQVADPLWHRQEAFSETALALAAPLPILMLLSIGLGWLVVRTTLGSVARVKTQIESRGGRNLEPLDLDGVPSELLPIVESVDRMLERLSHALEIERGLASSSAHELRTPIAAALAQTQRLVASLPPGDGCERGRAIVATLEELGLLAEKLLQLSRAEAGMMNTGEADDGLIVVQCVISEYQDRVGQEYQIRYASVGIPRFLSQLDPDGLAIVVRNLIENAIKHGAPDSPIDVVLDGSRNSLQVINGSAVIPPSAVKRLRQRFERGATHAPGSGLGLTIVDTILRHSDLVLELKSPATGRVDGFEAVLKQVSSSDGEVLLTTSR